MHTTDCHFKRRMSGLIFLWHILNICRVLLSVLTRRIWNSNWFFFFLDIFIYSLTNIYFNITCIFYIINKKICHLIGIFVEILHLIFFSGVNGFFFLSKFKIITSTTDWNKNNNTGILTFLILIHQMTQLIWYIHNGFIFF